MARQPSGKNRPSLRKGSSSVSPPNVETESHIADPPITAGLKRPAPGLHIVATPIGNLRDITLRALDTLKGADIIAAEDTRVTGRLLRHFDISTPQTSYHEHNAERVRPGLIKRLKQGDIVALVSDAGTPLINDPGYRLVADAVAAGVPVTANPGPSAVLAALVSSALPTDRFLFAGFLPTKSGQRQRVLTEVAEIDATLVFFESATRLARSLTDMAAVLGPRDAVVARELTKMYEELRRGPLDALAQHYTEDGAPKGEVVLVVGPAAAADTWDDAAIDQALRRALASMTVRDAAASVSTAANVARRKVYARALALTDEAGGASEDGSAGEDGNADPDR